MIVKIILKKFLDSRCIPAYFGVTWSCTLFPSMICLASFNFIINPQKYFNTDYTANMRVSGLNLQDRLLKASIVSRVKPKRGHSHI